MDGEKGLSGCAGGRKKSWIPGWPGTPGPDGTRRVAAGLCLLATRRLSRGVLWAVISLWAAVLGPWKVPGLRWLLPSPTPTLTPHRPMRRGCASSLSHPPSLSAPLSSLGLLSRRPLPSLGLLSRRQPPPLIAARLAPVPLVCLRQCHSSTSGRAAIPAPSAPRPLRTRTLPSTATLHGQRRDERGIATTSRPQVWPCCTAA